MLELSGMRGISALSLSATLNRAAAICPELTAEGVRFSGGGYGSGSGSRDGEAFAAAIQNRLEECIFEDEATYKDQLRKSLEQKKTKNANKIIKNAIGPLHEASIKAYSAHIRSYPAKEKAVRHIFSPRALHLGHVARSFALKEQPKALAGKRRAAEGSDDEQEDVLNSTGRKRNQRLAFGNMSSGELSGKRDEAAAFDDDILAADTIGRIAKKGKKESKSFADPTDLAAFDSIMASNKSKSKKKSKMTSGSGLDGGERRSVGLNKKRMMARAIKMQGSGLSEFF